MDGETMKLSEWFKIKFSRKESPTMFWAKMGLPTLWELFIKRVQDWLWIRRPSDGWKQMETDRTIESLLPAETVRKLREIK